MHQTHMLLNSARPTMVQTPRNVLPQAAELRRLATLFSYRRLLMLDARHVSMCSERNWPRSLATALRCFNTLRLLPVQTFNRQSAPNKSPHSGRTKIYPPRDFNNFLDRIPARSCWVYSVRSTTFSARAVALLRFCYTVRTGWFFRY